LGKEYRLLRIHGIILVHVDDQRTRFACLSPNLLYCCVGEVAARARRSIVCLIGLRTVSNTVTRDLRDDNTLVKPAGTGRVCPISSYEVSVKL
jgi:hypothetical protein